MAQKPGQLYRALGATGQLADQARPAVANRRKVVPQIVDRPKTARFILLTFIILSLGATLEDFLRNEIGIITGILGIGMVFLGRGMLTKADLAYLVATPPAAFLIAVIVPDALAIARSANPINQLGATVFTHLSNLAPFVLITFGISFLFYKVANRNLT